MRLPADTHNLCVTYMSSEAVHGRRRGRAREMAGTLCLLTVFLTLCGASTFPGDVRICSAKDPGIDACFVDNANKMLMHLRTGLRSLDMVPTEPLFIPVLAMRKGNSVFPTLSFVLSNSSHLGWGAARAVDARADPDNYSFNVTFFLPTYEVLGDYAIDGRLLFVDLEGDGKLNLKFYNNTYRIKVTGEPKTRDGRVHMHIKSFVIDATLDDMFFDVENLFNNKVLSDATNSVLNWNSRAIAQSGSPALQEIYGDLYKGLMQRLFDKVPYSELFRDLS